MQIGVQPREVDVMAGVNEAADERERQLERLYETLRCRQPKRRVQRLVEFARHFYATAARTDLKEWRLDDLYGATIACWQFLQEYSGDSAKVRVFNPQVEEHGWQSTHTVIALLHTDMPFIVDSVRILLNRRNLTIHAIHSAVLAVRRSERHQLRQLLPLDSRARKLSREMLVSIEVDRHTDPAQLADLEQALAFLLAEVRVVVEDFDAMLERAGRLIEEMRQIPAQFDAADMREAAEFIRWLRHHFTFLGYDEYQLVEKPGASVLEPVEGSQLGLLKICDENLRSELIQGASGRRGTSR
ncbi:hypothetical protein [Marinobacterium aestuariivivens]|uniref:NAD-glutamate dehydrogenase N-terminal ACT1 domain-containing protein n=1 Tax=Marinobacterium aestuariivivens TaxID=1698799 RepID=A0ABW1ZVF3_9GAMM